MHRTWSIGTALGGVAVARRRASRAFAEAGLDAREVQVLVLLVSELVTNALVHARPPVRLVIDVDGERTRIEVRDAATRVPHVRSAAISVVGGRGLVLVDDLATRWGTRVDDDGKTVWLELERATPASAAATAGAGWRTAARA